MKLTFKTLLYLSFFPFYCLAQTPQYSKLDNLRLIIRYELKYQEDSTDIYSTRQEPMVLLIGEKISTFKSYNALYTDTILKQLTRTEDLIPQLTENARNNKRRRILFSIFKHFPENTLYYYEPILFDNFTYKESLPLFQWKIENEQRKQYGYTLQKATTRYGGRDWTAWFALEIPISDGPYKFCGLPGLIVHIEDSKRHYVFELLSIAQPSKAGNIEISQSQTHIPTTRDIFIQTKIKSRQNLAQNARASGNVQSLNPADDILVQERARRRNNPIELSADD